MSVIYGLEQYVLLERSNTFTCCYKKIHFLSIGITTIFFKKLIQDNLYRIAFIAFMLLLFMCWIMIYGLMCYFETNRGKMRMKNIPTDKILLSYTFVLLKQQVMFSNFPGIFKHVTQPSFQISVHFFIKAFYFQM